MGAKGVRVVPIVGGYHDGMGLIVEGSAQEKVLIVKHGPPITVAKDGVLVPIPKEREAIYRFDHEAGVYRSEE